MAYMGGRLPLEEGRDAYMTVYEALMLMLTFGILIVAMLSFRNDK